MSHAGFAVELTNHTENDCAIADPGPNLQPLDENHELQYPGTTSPSAPTTAAGNTVLPAAATGIIHGRYVDGPVCGAQDGPDVEKPRPTAYLRVTLPDDPNPVDVPFSAIIYCHGSIQQNPLEVG
ncbi:hypothetical protein [Nocardia sp. BMG111209]|uniref:hypothetical protein n=1 Tax=Nocardia sp. BMG111209 TaxID=1160137 RepID=UPI000365E10E|nr:hypothetical protein [Nocardia sp. BMG111209]